MNDLLLKPIVVVLIMLMSFLSSQSDAVQEIEAESEVVISGDILIDDREPHMLHQYPLVEISEGIREVLLELEELAKEKGGKHAFIGILLDDEADHRDNGAGVRVIGVTPGGPAEKAGIETGDVVVSISGKSLAADEKHSSASKLFKQLGGFKPGDKLAIGLLREGREITVELIAANRAEHHLKIKALTKELDHGMPHIEKEVLLHKRADSLERMELFKLNRELGEYFSSEKGMLVLWVPEHGELGLKSGDVILTIGGRSPRSTSQTWRIFDSYDAGDEIPFTIMRKHQKLDLSFIKP